MQELKPETIGHNGGNNSNILCIFGSETVQITHTGVHHWVLLSSMYSKIPIYDSLNLQPTDFLLNQIRQLFSYDNSMPNFEQIKCYEQVGSTDCRLFAIAYAVDILNGYDV